jgi:hypothetical protein
MGLAISLVVHYSLDCRSNALSIDSRVFKQATLHFYIQTLDSAIKNKLKWRNDDRGTKGVQDTIQSQKSMSKIKKMSSTSHNKEIYLKELLSMNNWEEGIT